MTELKGFRQMLKDYTRRELKTRFGFTKPEATSTAAIDVLNTLSLKNYNQERSETISAEIQRRAELIYSSPVRKSAEEKVVEKLLDK